MNREPLYEDECDWDEPYPIEARIIIGVGLTVLAGAVWAGGHLNGWW